MCLAEEPGSQGVGQGESEGPPEVWGDQEGLANGAPHLGASSGGCSWPHMAWLVSGSHAEGAVCHGQVRELGPRQEGGRA